MTSMWMGEKGRDSIYAIFGARRSQGKNYDAESHRGLRGGFMFPKWEGQQFGTVVSFTLHSVQGNWFDLYCLILLNVKPLVDYRELHYLKN